MTGSGSEVGGKRFLVTGGGGFIGARAVRLLAQMGCRVRVLSVERDPWRLAPVKDDIEYVCADLNDPEALALAIHGVDGVLHFAATGLRWGPTTSFETLVRANLLGTYALIRAAGDAGVERVVLAGSVFEFGGHSSRDADSDLSPHMRPSPLNLYGVTKAASTLVAPVVGDEAGVQTITLRVFSPYGPGEPRFRLIPSIIEAARARRPLKVTLGEQVRDYCYVDDVARAFIEAAAMEIDGHRLFHLGTGQATSVKDVTRLVLSKLGAPSLAEFGALEYRTGEVFRLVADASDLDPRLATCLSTSLEDGIQRTIDWFENNEDSGT